MQRYVYGEPIMVADDEGDWVTYEDTAAALAEARGEIERLRGALAEFQLDDAAWLTLEAEPEDCWSGALVKANRVLRGIDTDAARA